MWHWHSHTRPCLCSTVQRCIVFADSFVSRCTWEPAESFIDLETLQDWSKKRDAGAEISDDLIENIDTKINAYLDAKAFRKARRQNKRRRLAARRVSSSLKSSIPFVPAVASHKQQGTGKDKPSSSSSGRRLLESAESRKLLVTNHNLVPPKLTGDRADPSVQTTTTQPPVFHGFSIGNAKRGGYCARRTGNQRASSTTTFRNLRHMNVDQDLTRKIEESPIG